MARAGFDHAVTAVQRHSLGGTSTAGARDGFLLRYRPEHDDHVDGPLGGEGAFLARTCWPVDALHNIGRVQEASAHRRVLNGLAHVRW
ncbi:hypothetical protein [Micromonospora chersina]|uniref:hypothetical protein n=1 Tax=Micromonospora chersina TaxID=47854 RepID=UPI0033D5EDF8